jgi:hypothetical protein
MPVADAVRVVCRYLSTFPGIEMEQALQPGIGAILAPCLALASGTDGAVPKSAPVGHAGGDALKLTASLSAWSHQGKVK